MFGLRFLPRRCRQVVVTTGILGVVLPFVTGCSAIDKIEKTHEVFDTLKEADRQFTIEDTPDGALPNDTEAKNWINRALVLMPHSDVPYIGDEENIGIIGILINRGRYPLLIDLLNKAIADPKLVGNPDLLFTLADAEERMGPASEATKTYALALTALKKSFGEAGTTFDPDSPILIERATAEYYGGQRAQSLKDFTTIINSRPELSAEASNDFAYMLALDKTDLPRALTLSKSAVASARSDGDDTTVGIYEDTLAWVDHQQGDDKDALYYEQEAASLDPLQADVQYHLGEIARANGQILLARAAYDRAIDLNPFFPEARKSLASLPPTSPVVDTSEDDQS
jgi:tetratricopeptide (TPR) repeat protein